MIRPGARQQARTGISRRPTVAFPTLRPSTGSTTALRSRIGVPLGSSGRTIRGGLTPSLRQDRSITRRGNTSTRGGDRSDQVAANGREPRPDSGTSSRGSVSESTRRPEAVSSTRGQHLLDASRLRRSLATPPLTRRYTVGVDRTHGTNNRSRITGSHSSGGLGIARERALRDRHEVTVGQGHHTRAANRYLSRTTNSRYVTYHDRPHAIHHGNNYLHRYYDSHHRSYHHAVWPDYSYLVHYSVGHHSLMRHVYPFHHRKYIFVSLGGYWPSSYWSLRYYWYGWHPYTWYGYNPVPQLVAGTTNNYYTYNMGGDQNVASAANALEAVGDPGAVVKPPQEGPADLRFADGVQAFEKGDYAAATDHFSEAMALDAQDIILPFAFAQALFAEEEYRDAIEVLRMALGNVNVEQATIFYPRGLYQDDDTLFTQVDELIKLVETKSQDTGLQLLLGYHLLGIGETDAALDSLERASLDPENEQAASLLIDLLAKVKAQEIESD
ncbi:MAG: tetratricopeptide repeat protein [Planctomycetes bacterium]|nr:tetratricopeptide repeat protein [Planctomycetota bacterium]